jgi:hypothetical protein
MNGVVKFRTRLQVARYRYFTNSFTDAIRRGQLLRGIAMIDFCASR